MELFNRLKVLGRKYETDYGLSALAVLAITGADLQSFADSR